jgi:hypothetical protein
VLKNPLAGDDVGANRARDKISGVVGDQGSKLFFYGVASVQINADGKGYHDKVDTERGDRVSLSLESRKPRFTRVVIG